MQDEVREVAYLHFYDRRSVREIAPATGRTEDAVEDMPELALRTLRGESPAR